MFAKRNYRSTVSKSSGVHTIDEIFKKTNINLFVFKLILTVNISQIQFNIPHITVGNTCYALLYVINFEISPAKSPENNKEM